MIVKIYPPQAGTFSAPSVLAPGANVRHRFAHPVYGNLTLDVVTDAPTRDEIDAVLAPVVDKDAECRKAFDANPDAPANVDLWKVIKAVAISNLARALGVAPGALTPAQLVAERNRIAGIYAAL
jgi:hypothetical protein